MIGAMCLVTTCIFIALSFGQHAEAKAPKVPKKQNSKSIKTPKAPKQGKSMPATMAPIPQGPTEEAYKVNLIILTESGCPPCEREIIGPMNDLIQTPGFSEILNVRQFSWGNHYFETEYCGGGDYNYITRHCWAAHCIDTGEPMKDCFGPGKLVSQHGEKEIQFNKIQACAAALAGWNNWQPYWPFLVCTEVQYALTDDVFEATKNCTSSGSSFYDYQELVEYCDSPAGDEALLRNAMRTFDHPGTPWILVNGSPPDEDTYGSNATMAAVCQEYQGDSLPPTCDSFMDD